MPRHQDVPPVNLDDLRRELGSLLSRPPHSIRAVALGASSRETPWRIDRESERGVERLLVRFGASCSANEVAALEAMDSHALPTPKVLLWDEKGTRLGVPLFVSSYIDGGPLLAGMKANEPWAEELYVDTVCEVQSITANDLPPGSMDKMGGSESALDVLDKAHGRFHEPSSLVEAAYRRLKETWPGAPGDRFSNGDLWPENFLVQDERLVGIIDWQHAGLTDPIFEFLLPFFLVPELRERGIEEAYCARMGFDPAVLAWYHGLEFFDSLSFVLKLGKPYEMHTAETLQRDLEHWLDEN